MRAAAGNCAFFLHASSCYPIGLPRPLLVGCRRRVQPESLCAASFALITSGLGQLIDLSVAGAAVCQKQAGLPPSASSRCYFQAMLVALPTRSISCTICAAVGRVLASRDRHGWIKLRSRLRRHASGCCAAGASHGNCFVPLAPSKTSAIVVSAIFCAIAS